jgi:hypothetical protein
MRQDVREKHQKSFIELTPVVKVLKRQVGPCAGVLVQQPGISLYFIGALIPYL